MSQTAATLGERYTATSERTLAAWRLAPDCGDIMQQGYYDPHKLALASGIQPPMPAAIAALRYQLVECVNGDTLADVMPADGLHFTFLPVTQPRYADEEQPEGLASLRALWRASHPQTVHIRELRLVALPGQLLLAGIPDEHSERARRAFCDALLASDWRDLVIARHTHTPLPPPFWHTTLLRYRAQYLPLSLRHFFLENCHQYYGDVEGNPILARINYNWTRVYPID